MRGQEEENEKHHKCASGWTDGTPQARKKFWRNLQPTTRAVVKESLAVDGGEVRLYRKGVLTRTQEGSAT